MSKSQFVALKQLNNILNRKEKKISDTSIKMN